MGPKAAAVVSTKSCHRVNNGHPFAVYRMQDESLCVRGEEGVWTEYALIASKRPLPEQLQRRPPGWMKWTTKRSSTPAAASSTPAASAPREVARVDLPEIPAQYGSWEKASIGGVSDTCRRVGLLHAPQHVRSNDPFVLFATHAPTAASVRDAFERDGAQQRARQQEERGEGGLGDATLAVRLGETAEYPDFGFVTEVCVLLAEDVERAAAVIASAGANVLADAGGSASSSSSSASSSSSRGGGVILERSLGVERLDRIESMSTAELDKRTIDTEDAYGMRRGGDNWRFPWLPPGWEAPLTWDRLVRNVRETPGYLEPIPGLPGRRRPTERFRGDAAALPQPLRQHVAIAQLTAADAPPLGTRWATLPAPVAERKVAEGKMAVWEDAPASLREALADGRREFSDAEAASWTPARPLVWYPPRVPESRKMLARDAAGVYYEPLETRRLVPLRGPAAAQPLNIRYVSAALSEAQSQQLITAFYTLCVARARDPVISHACELILFRYMIEGGYTARWMGKYDQHALHVGNGWRFRKLAEGKRELVQYRHQNLPAQVLNRLCGRDGRVHARGAKGSRSKYETDAEKRYVPKRRLKRKLEEEERMVAPA